MDRIGFFVLVFLVCGSLLVSALPDECYIEMKKPKVVCDGPTPWDCHIEYVMERMRNIFIQPEITSVDIEPDTALVNEEVTIEVDAKDKVGVMKIKVTIGSRSTSLSLNSGNEQEGTWKGEIKAPGPGKYSVEIEIENICRNGYTKDDMATLTVPSSGGDDDDDDDKRFDVEIGEGCANEPVTVTVTRRDRGVEDAIVKLYYDDEEVDKDSTDKDGEATVVPPYEGDYELVVSRSGYRTEKETFSITCTYEQEGDGSNGTTEPAEGTYNISWLPVEEQLFYAGAKNIVEATLQNTGDGRAGGIALGVVNCPENWECGVAPASVALGPDESRDAYAWFVVPENESEEEKDLSLSFDIGDESGAVTFKAGIKLTNGEASTAQMEAYDAINRMKGEIEKARMEGKDVSDAANTLMAAQNVFAEDDYEMAQSYALLVLAQLAKGEEAKEGEAPSGIDMEMLGIAAMVVVALLVMGGAAIYFTTKKNGNGRKGYEMDVDEKEIEKAVKKVRKRKRAG